MQTFWVHLQSLLTQTHLSGVDKDLRSLFRCCICICMWLNMAEEKDRYSYGKNYYRRFQYGWHFQWQIFKSLWHFKMIHFQQQTNCVPSANTPRVCAAEIVRNSMVSKEGKWKRQIFLKTGA